MLDLSLHHYPIGSLSGFTIGETIGHLPNLETIVLYLENNNLKDDGINQLTAGITKAPKLRKLVLDLNQNNIHDDGALALIQGL